MISYEIFGSSLNESKIYERNKSRPRASIYKKFKKEGSFSKKFFFTYSLFLIIWQSTWDRIEQSQVYELNQEDTKSTVFKGFSTEGTFSKMYFGTSLVIFASYNFPWIL